MEKKLVVLLAKSIQAHRISSALRNLSVGACFLGFDMYSHIAEELKKRVSRDELVLKDGPVVIPPEIPLPRGPFATFLLEDTEKKETELVVISSGEPCVTFHPTKGSMVSSSSSTSKTSSKENNEKSDDPDGDGDDGDDNKKKSKKKESKSAPKAKPKPKPKTKPAEKKRKVTK